MLTESLGALLGRPAMSVHAYAQRACARLWLRLSRRLLVTGSRFRVTRGTKLARTFLLRLASEVQVLGLSVQGV